MDNDLRRYFAVLIGEPVDDFLIEHPSTAPGRRVPGFDLDLVGGVPSMRLTLLRQWMKLNLADHRYDASFINQPLQMRDLRITRADIFHQPLLLQLDQRLPGFDVMADRRHWSVDQIKIHIIEFQLAEASFQRLVWPFLIVAPRLGGDEQLIAVDTCAVQHIADAGLISVHDGGVRRVITNFQRLMSGGDDFLVASFLHVETQLRRQIAVV